MVIVNGLNNQQATLDLTTLGETRFADSRSWMSLYTYRDTRKPKATD